MNKLAKRLYEERKKLKMNKLFFAKHIGIGVQALVRLERNNAGPKTLKKVAAYFGMTISEVLNEYHEQS